MSAAIDMQEVNKKLAPFGAECHLLHCERVPAGAALWRWCGDVCVPGVDGTTKDDGGLYTAVTKRGSVLGVKLASLEAVAALVEEFGL